MISLELRVYQSSILEFKSSIGQEGVPTVLLEMLLRL